jgi:lipoprotein-anchoring transpeptidase ErfK/SrfK
MRIHLSARGGAIALVLALAVAGLLPTGRAFAAPACCGSGAEPRPYTAVPHNPPPPIVFSSPALTSAAGVWLGELNRASNIRTGPGLSYAPDRAWLKGRRVLVYGTAVAANGEVWYQVGHYPDPELYIHSSLVDYVAPLAGALQFHTGRWIDVNLSQQTITAYQDAQPVLLSQISSGKPGHETLTGTWHIYWRLLKQDMDGGGESPDSPYYNLKDVQWVQYFQMTGQALHAAYWHDNFGRPMSHGCVNLTYQTSNWLYLWANLGTTVEVHN